MLGLTTATPSLRVEPARVVVVTGAAYVLGHVRVPELFPPQAEDPAEDFVSITKFLTPDYHP